MCGYLGLLFASCDKKEINSNTQTIVKPVSDPVADLKTAITNATITKSKHDDEWTNITYDVRKTDSLVSPYQATISANLQRPGSTSREDCEMTLSYQDDKWVIKSITRTSLFLMGEPPVWKTARKDEKLPQNDPRWSLIEFALGLK